MKYLLIDAIIEETLINKFYGAAYQGLNNNLLGNCVINLYMCFGLINRFYGAVAGDRKNLVNQYSDERRKC